MPVSNSIVGALVRSPLPWPSRSLCLLRWSGRRSGTTYTTPVQYARDGDGIVVLAGRPGTKTWWRNFRDEHDLDVFLDRRWVPMRGLAVVGAGEALDTYRARFPKAAIEPAEAVVVRCRPR